MNSKLIMFLGTVLSALVIYLCIYYKKDEISLLLGVGTTPTTYKSIDFKQNKNATEPNEIEEIAQTKEVTKAENVAIKEQPPQEEIVETKAVTEKSDPAFGLMIGDITKIVGMLSPRDRSKALINYINEYCKNSECDKDIRYSEDIKDVIWQKGIVKLIKFLKEENIEKGSIFINSNVLKVEGEITSIDQKDRLSSILTSLKNDGLEVIDQSVELLTNTKQKENTKRKKEEIVETVEKTRLNSSENSIRKDIENILSENSIEFDSKSGELTKNGKEILDKIVKILENSNTTKIEIASYSQKSDDDIFEKVISQKRADIVKKYINKNLVIDIVSKGYGATDFKYMENPQDLRNKRIEIRILK